MCIYLSPGHAPLTPHPFVQLHSPVKVRGRSQHLAALQTVMAEATVT